MKRMLIVSGSPRKRGDGFHAAQRLAEAVSQRLPLEVEFLYLSDYPLEPCRGCMVCLHRGEEYCPHFPVFREFMIRLDTADIVVLSSPVYAHQISALMKNFIDHGAFIFHRPRFYEKPAIVLATSAGSGLPGTLRYLELVASGWGFHLTDRIGVLYSWFHDSNAKYQLSVERRMNRAAKRLACFFRRGGRPSPRWKELWLFSGLRMKARQFECDSRYWAEKGWFDKPFYADVPVNPLTSGLIRWMERLGTRYMDRMAGKYRKKDLHDGTSSCA